MKSTRILLVLIGLTCALALAGTAAAAAATKAKQPPILFTVQNVGPADCPAGSLFGLSFDMVSPRGTGLGAGTSCVQMVEGCTDAAGCRTKITTTFTLDFRRGVLTVPAVLNEFWLTDTTVFTVDRGSISAGTGDFAGATGSLTCVGTIEFTATGVVPRLPCLVHFDD